MPARGTFARRPRTPGWPGRASCATSRIEYPRGERGESQYSSETPVVVKSPGENHEDQFTPLPRPAAPRGAAPVETPGSPPKRDPLVLKIESVGFHDGGIRPTEAPALGPGWDKSR